jgi:hypothetical protein
MTTNPKPRELTTAREMAEAVHPIYVVNDWKWGRGKNSNIPSIMEIEETIESLVKEADDDAAEDRGSVHSTGRLAVRVSGLTGDIDVMLKLGSFESKGGDA